MSTDPLLITMLEGIKSDLREHRADTKKIDDKLDTLVVSNVNADNRIQSLEETRSRQKRAAKWAGATLFTTLMGWLGFKT